MIREWGELASDPLSSIRLPAFQRSAAWNEARVELLWDSLTRGMPIGALLFARPQAGAACRPLSNAPMAKTRPLEDARSPLLLVDGQQRLTALKIGFRPFSDGQACRLWIDLAPPKTKESRKRGRFRLCSRVHPWGAGASVARRREARGRIGCGDRNDDVDLPLGNTWPLDARIPVDAASLIMRLFASPSVTPAWEDLLPPPLSPHPAALAEVEGPDGLRGVVAGLLGLDRSCLVGLLVGIATMEELGEAFSRLNSQGVRIALSASGGPRSDIDALTVDAFDELEKQTGGQLVPQLQCLLAKAGLDGRGGRMHTALSVARRMLQHRDSPDGSDPGLPRTLLGQLHWRSWHTVAAWAERHCLAPGEFGEESRLEAIRLVLLLHFFVPTGKSFVARGVHVSRTNSTFFILRNGTGFTPGFPVTTPPCTTPSTTCPTTSTTLCPATHSTAEEEPGALNSSGMPRPCGDRWAI